MGLLRGMLIVACGGAGIAMAVFLGQSPPGKSAAAHRGENAHAARRLPLLSLPAPPRPRAEPELSRTHPGHVTLSVPVAPRAELRTEVAVEQSTAMASPAAQPLMPALPAPAVAQDAAAPDLGNVDSILKILEAAKGLMGNQAPGQGAATGGVAGLRPPRAAGGRAVGAGALPGTAGEEPEEPGEAPPSPTDAPVFHLDPGTPGPDGEERFAHFDFDGDIRQVLELLASQGNLNILPTKSVFGPVSVVFNNVTLREALDAICRSNGLVVRQQGNLIYVGTTEDFQTLNQSLEQVGTRVFRPNYVSALDLQQLLTPLLTPQTGKISVTTASQSGIASDGDDAGGNSLALGDAVVVQDYESVLAQMEQIVAEIDVKPLQVAIEAMILSVKLNDKNAFGINWNFLLSNQHVRLATGSVPATVANGATPKSFAGDGFDNGAGNIFLPNGGLAFAFLDQNLGSFVTALETIGDTDVIASPRLMCLNKQRAEILIGAKLGYVSTTVTETSTAQTVEFLEVGAQLRIRPFISTDGQIRMEVHPELSTGTVRIAEGFTLPDKEVTQVTTNIMVRDGCTVVIGGLMREDLTVNTSQVPLLGSLPGVGFLFRQREETVERREILVLVTPHIAYDPELCAEGQKGACEFHRRQRSYLDSGNPLGRDYLGRKYLRLAQQALAAGDVAKATRLVDLAVRFDANNRAALTLQNDLAAGRYDGEHRGSARLLYDPEMLEEELPAPGQGEPAPVEAIGPEAIDGAEIDPRVLEQLQGGALHQPAHPRDPGQPGSVRDILPGQREFD